jgi:hypothetical protein
MLGSWERWILITPQLWAEDELVARALGSLRICEGNVNRPIQSDLTPATFATNSMAAAAVAHCGATPRPTISLQHGRGRRELSSRRPPFPFAEDHM